MSALHRGIPYKGLINFLLYFLHRQYGAEGDVTPNDEDPKGSINHDSNHNLDKCACPSSRLHVERDLEFFYHAQEADDHFQEYKFQLKDLDVH